MGYVNLADSNQTLGYRPWEGTDGLGHSAMFRWDTVLLEWVKFSGTSSGVAADVTVLNFPAPLSVFGGGTEASALRVTIANDSTGVLSVDDNGGSLTVDGTVSISGTVAVTQSGTWNINDISGTISLPTGASTSANQATIIASLSSIDAGIPAGLGQTTMSASMPVVIASDQTAIPVSQSDSWTVTANAGTNLNTSALALESGGNLAASATSLAVIDDWDESDRAKVNPIVGQAGVQGGSGVVTALTQRVVLATDVTPPLPSGAATEATLAAMSAKFTSTLGTDTRVSASTSSVTVLAANASRKGGVFHNDSTSACKVKAGTTASGTSYCFPMGAGDIFFLENIPNYNGIYTAIWTTATGAMQVTEFT